jgi:TldD protein
MSFISTPTHIIEDTLFKPASFAAFDLQKLIFNQLHSKIDYADIYLQNTLNESWILEDRQVKRGSFSIDRGAGIRVVSGEKTGFAYCDDINMPSIQEALNAAKTIASSGIETKAQQLKTAQGAGLYLPVNPLDSLSSEEKIQLLHRLDEYARSLDTRITHVNASISAEYDVVSIINSKGVIAGDVRPLVHVSVTVWIEHQGRRESGRSGGGGRFDFQEVIQQNIIETIAQRAVHEAQINLESIASPAGTMEVVLGPGWPGILLHEAVGHGLEGDFNRKQISTFSGQMGKQVAAKGVTVVDNGTIPKRRGSLNIDDEGTPTQCTTLIEDGVLVNYMQDELNARLMGMKSTGNCRREAYNCIPMPRMTNTYMLNGQHTQEEMIQSVKKGIFAVNFGGGQVDITSGQFVFTISEAYLIENGKITQPIKGATLIGNGPEVMKKISMIGNDLQLDPGIGTCGKDGQSVPVGVGQPSLKITEIVVGGTAS